uniref:CHK kinase-like domain-containing protein n=1 Tax=Alexandrium catenella TaxID=2925 RepID=A0A7S1S643_ALECA|mmetsp:Transcript_86814/g.230674  ORF Transcript_86814/g.230674 Transcript_86814/m.230674 type:complete len:538 (+) Transcript_86814:1-1614(+)
MAGVVRDMALQAAEDAWESAAAASPEARVHMRCEREWGRPTVTWFPVGLDTVTDNHEKIANGVMYGLPFPWSEETMASFGPEWLTTAFHACGSMPKRNSVTKVIIDERRVTAGNNSGKFMFDVEYAHPDPALHTKLFAKVPFAMTPATKSDRFSSSVYKQPMDFFEVNTYRLFENSFPMKTPRFYYGDISNESTNFIIIMERVAFAELDGPGQRKLKAYEIEGPYDKCKDFQLRGQDREYYTQMLRVSARIAAFHKVGRFGHQDFLQQNISMPRAVPDRAAWGCHPWAATGLPPEDLARKLQVAYGFVSDTAKVLYPDYVATEGFREKFLRTMMTRAAYSAEIDFWKNNNPDYVALGHQNLNIDNAYFWRDSDGQLDCGIYDWGGFGSSSLGHKIYWMFNCSDFDQFRENLDHYLDTFISMYRESGGPQLDKGLLRMQVLLTSLENMQFMVLAVPNCFKMCPTKEWATIRDRHDPRIAGNIDGKSTLRTTLHCLLNGLRILEEVKSDDILSSWIQKVYVGEWGEQPKPDAIIWGNAA